MSSSTTRHRTTRLLAGLGLASGLLLVTRPQQVLDRLAPAFPAERRWLIRVLGARLVAQHAVVLLAPAPDVVRVASAVDLVHAASMVPFVASRRYGRAARISGGLAAAYAAVALGLAPPTDRPAPSAG